jgi:hypothetical protein
VPEVVVEGLEVLEGSAEEMRSTMPEPKAETDITW